MHGRSGNKSRLTAAAVGLMDRNGKEEVEVIKMAAGSLVDGEAEDEGTSVWVIMDDGDLVEADEYLLQILDEWNSNGPWDSRAYL